MNISKKILKNLDFLIKRVIISQVPMDHMIKSKIISFSIWLLILIPATGTAQEANDVVEKFVQKVSSGNFSNFENDLDTLLSINLDNEARQAIAFAELDRLAIMGEVERYRSLYRKYMEAGLVTGRITENKGYGNLQLGYAAKFTEDYDHARSIFLHIFAKEENQLWIRCRAALELGQMLIGPAEHNKKFVLEILEMSKVCPEERLINTIFFQGLYSEKIADFGTEEVSFWGIFHGITKNTEFSVSDRIGLGTLAQSYFFFEGQPTIALTYSLEVLQLLKDHGYEGTAFEVIQYFNVSISLNELGYKEKGLDFFKVGARKFKAIQRETSHDWLMWVSYIQAHTGDPSDLIEIATELGSWVEAWDEESFHLYFDKIAANFILMSTYGLPSEIISTAMESLNDLLNENELSFNAQFQIDLFMAFNKKGFSEKLELYQSALKKTGDLAHIYPGAKTLWSAIINHLLADLYIYDSRGSASDVSKALYHAEAAAEQFKLAIELDSERRLLEALDNGKINVLDSWFLALVDYQIKNEITDQSLDLDYFRAMTTSRYNSIRRAFSENVKRIPKSLRSELDENWINGMSNAIKSRQKLDYSIFLARQSLLRKIDVNSFDLKDITDEIYTIRNTSETLRRIDREFPKIFSNLTTAFQQRNIENFAIMDRLTPWDTAYLVMQPVNEQYVFTVIGQAFQGNGLHWVDKQKIDLLSDKLLKNMKTSNMTPRLEDYDFESAYHLFELVFDRDLLKFLDVFGTKKLVFFGIGALENFPLEVLVSRRPTEKDIAANTISWLDKKFEIYYDFDISQALEKENYRLTRTQPVQLQNKKFLGVGAPELSETYAMARDINFIPNSSLAPPIKEYIKTLPSLPEARAEISLASRVFNDGNTTIVTGNQATEGSFKQLDLSKFDVIMFSTHTLAANEHPDSDEPGLVFTPSEIEEEDAILTAREIMNLDLNAEIVFLNACNTANYTGLGNNGGFKLSASFLIAGARSVMVSHWPILDKSTRELNDQIFKTISEQPSISYTRALDNARKKIRTRPATAHPFYWGAFKIYEPFSVDVFKEIYLDDQ